MHVYCLYIMLLSIDRSISSTMHLHNHSCPSTLTGHGIASLDYTTSTLSPKIHLLFLTTGTFLSSQGSESQTVEYNCMCHRTRNTRLIQLFPLNFGIDRTCCLSYVYIPTVCLKTLHLGDIIWIGSSPLM